VEPSIPRRSLRPSEKDALRDALSPSIPCWGFRQRQPVDGFAAEFGGDSQVALGGLDRLVSGEGLDVGNIAAGLEEPREERGAEFVGVGGFDPGALRHALDNFVDMSMALAADGGEDPARRARHVVERLHEANSAGASSSSPRAEINSQDPASRRSTAASQAVEVALRVRIPQRHCPPGRDANSYRSEGCSSLVALSVSEWQRRWSEAG
jgi:hypothetical protein